MKTCVLPVVPFLLALLLLCGIPVTQAQQVLPRENIKTFSQDPVKLKKLRDAVQALQSRGLDNSLSWFTMAGIHQIRADDPQLSQVPASLQALFRQCHRDEDLFFLWHRAYVSSLEKLLQDAINDPNFRLPYWNWYEDPALPEPFRNEFLDPAKTQKNSLYRANRLPGVNNGGALWNPSYDTNYDEDDFGRFQDDLNFNEHGMIHMLIGGAENMGNPRFAARDPIFFLHHSNIDRLLMAWLKKDPTGHKAPTNFPGWQSSVYRFPVPPAVTGGAAPNVKTPTVAELALGAMQAMGYTYDNMDLPPLSQPPLPAAPAVLLAGPVLANAEGPKETFAASKEELSVSSGVTLELPIKAESKPKVSMLAAMNSAPKSEAGLTLVFDKVRVKALPDGLTGYKVWVNLPKAGQTEGAPREHYVGTLSLFDLQHEDTSAGKSVKMKFSAKSGGDVVKKALEGSAGAGKVSVSLVPVLGAGKSAPKDAVISIREVRLEGQNP